MLALCRLLALVVLVAAASPSAHAQSTRVTLILTNDIYLMSDVRTPDGQRRGGFARLAAVVKAERAKGGHVLFAHGGDTLSPSIMSGIDRGAHIVTLTNMMPPDIFAPGNHEFDFGKAVFATRMAEAKFPIYAANLRGPDGQPLPNIRERGIVTFDGVRIGLTGAAYDDTARTSSPGDLKFLPTVATMKQQAETLRAEGADFVVAVMHARRQQALDLAATRSADVILTGHTHDLFLNYDGRTVLAESTFDAHAVVLIDIDIAVKERNGRRETTWQPSFRIVDTATVTPDPEVAAVVAGFEQELSHEMDVSLATTAVDLDSRSATLRTGESALGNLVADAMRGKSQAEVAIMNGGGIRSGSIYAAGRAVTRRDVLAELPFSNRVVTMAVRGGDIREALENGLSLLPNSSGRFPQISGMTVRYDPRQPPGRRITSIVIAGAPLDPDRIYRLATNDFLARGSDGYTALSRGRLLLPVEDSPMLANEVMVYLRKLGTIRAGIEGRIAAQ